MAARALFAGPGALRALRGGGEGTVELVFARAYYVRLGDDWLLLAEPDAAFGPLSLAVAGLERPALRPGQPARVDAGGLRVGDHGVSLERMRVRRPAAIARASEQGDGARAADAALGVIGPPPSAIAPGLVALRRGRVGEGARLLAGRGDGLTPAGDDVLAGYAAWRHSIGAEPVVGALAAGRSSPLGLAYLRCAERGELPDFGAALLAALRAGDRQAARGAARGLADWGASSGDALAWGIAAGATAQPDRAAPRYFAGVRA
jgi:hypothetical protein